MVLAAAEMTTEGGALARLDEALDEIRRVVAQVEPERVTGEEASLVLERFVKLDRAVAAGRLAFSRRVAECMTWREEGHRSAAEWLAQKTKVSVGEAKATLDTAKELPSLTATSEALLAGSISVAQVREIASAAAADPSAEGYLIETAGQHSLKGLQYRAQMVRNNAEDHRERAAQTHKSRYLNHWNDRDGGFHLHAKMTPESGAEVLDAIRSRAMFVAQEAQLAGVPVESEGAYRADALVALVRGDMRRDTFEGLIGGRRRTPSVVFHVSLEALRRGHAEHDELCEVPGVGPVPLAAIENIVGDATAKLVIRDGVDVTTVCHMGRTVPAHVETALEARDRTCVVPGCDVTCSLEIDHWQVPFAQGGPTALWNLARICHFHHQLKTYEGYELRGGPGQWEWVNPPAAGP